MRVDDFCRPQGQDFPSPAGGAASSANLATFLTAHRADGPGILELNAAPRRSTLAQIDAAARRIAGGLTRRHAPGERVLIGFGSGAEFFPSFLGCLLAGLIPAPAPPPGGSRKSRRLRDMAAACGAARLMADDAGADAAREIGLAFDTADELGAGEPIGRPAPADPAAPAYLQFTSGSTAEPRGVMISHRAAIANMQGMFEAAGGSVGPYVTWLPLFHDMGLVSTLAALARGQQVVMFDPGEFARRPWTWLEAISDHRAEYSGAPNFAYDLLARTARPADAAPIDLSCWKTAFIGAETVKASTMRRFARRYAVDGFSAQAATPAYGLAECTLMATATRRGDGARFVSSPETWRAGRARTVCDVGVPLDGHSIAIVHPETRRRAADGDIGEVWIDGPSKADGYWGLAEESAAVFRARLPGDPREYLRTGDLGFLAAGRLHIVGRIKETIIVRGRNIHPEEIETAAMKAHPALSEGAAAAFALGEKDGFGLLCEIRAGGGRAGADDIPGAVQAELARSLGVSASRICITRFGAAPRTTSGKLQRLACAKAIEDGRLRTFIDWRGSSGAPPRASDMRAPNAARIRDFILSFIALRTGIDPRLQPQGGSLLDSGLDSMGMIELGFALEDWLGVALDPSEIWRFATLDDFADHLALAAAGDCATTPRAARAPVAEPRPEPCDV